MSTIRVWDLPLRLFHWSLVFCVVSAYLCMLAAKQDSGWISQTDIDWMYWHTRCGYVVLGLLMFRIVWGFIGSRYARFTQFFPSPARLISYFRGQYQGLGHNPLGAFSVFTLIAVFSLQSLSGLFMDDFLWPGPLYSLYPELSKTMESIHRLMEPVMIGLVLLHIGAMLFYKWVKQHNLIPAMITGNTHATQGGIQESWGLWLRALLIAVLCALLVYWITGLGGSGLDDF